VGKKFKSVVVCVFLSAIITLTASACSTSEVEREPDANNEETAVVGLIISMPPDKTEYVQYEYFDPTGMVVETVFSDGTTKELEEYTVKPKRQLKIDDVYVSVIYGDYIVDQPITVTLKGNVSEYDVENTPEIEGSSLEGKTLFFLGSSVTLGYASENESMADYIAKRNNCTCIKEAVSGTTLADIESENRGDSYIKRLERYIGSEDKVPRLDAFICQLSTNDMYDEAAFGSVSADDIKDKTSFDKATTFGALEYIVALVKEEWNCPVIIYTNPYMYGDSYGKMVEAAHEIETKWDCVTVLDLYNDEDFNDITSDERSLYMSDTIHPTKAGYLLWWTPRFEECIKSVIDKN